MRRSPFAIAAVALALATLAEPTQSLGVGVDQIRDPRPAAWTVDLTGRLSSDAVNAINHLGNEVQQQTRGELAVVVVDSTDGADPHQFATDLFNRWQLGQAGKNNGLLVFAALSDRKAEIILGDGLDDEARVAASRQIMQEVILARFKQGDPGGAVFRGARACAEQILGVRLEPLQAEAADGDRKSDGASAAQPGQQLQPAPPAGPPAVAFHAVALHREPLSSVAWAWLLGCGSAVGAVLVFGARKLLRYRPQRCPGCGGAMTRLGEAADDEYLSQAERTEERLGSVDYDVWACGACGRTTKLRYGAFFTQYSRCPGCGATTKGTINRTVRAASYTQGGLVEVEETCRNCSYRSSWTRSTPILTHTPTTSPTVWSSTGTSAPSTSSSFGGASSGGHSSGGGASGGW